MEKFTARELFSTWYPAALKKEISGDELTNRQTTIDSVLKDEDPEFWISILKLSFREINTDENQKKFIKAFKDNDQNFPVQDNENLIQTLACCSILQKIQTGSNYLGDTLCLGVLASEILNKDQSTPIPNFTRLSLELWKERCIQKRQLSNPDPKIINPSLSKIEFKHAPGSGEFAEELKVLLVKVSKDLNQLTQNQSQLQKLTNTTKVLSEETNVLWWLFGEFSRDNQKSFSEISFPESIARIGKELSDLTEILPGFPNADNIIAKAISINVKDTESEIKFSAFVNSVNTELEAHISNAQIDALSSFTPCLSSIKQRSELSESKDVLWEKLVNSKYKINTDKSYKTGTLARQLYLELILCRCYNSI